MDKKILIDLAAEFTHHSPLNYIPAEIAINPHVAGMKIYEPPIFAFGDVDDELFSRLKQPNAIGPQFMLPLEWLPSACTVISFFLPFTAMVKKANTIDSAEPAAEWLHARVEGQQFLLSLALYLQKFLLEAGYDTNVPINDPRFTLVGDKNNVFDNKRNKRFNFDTFSYFNSNWSERHVAFVCGLGTFGLSKGLITIKGICGRLGSLITQLDLPKNKREYTEIYEYCSQCGACVRKCPAQAISLQEGKKHLPCALFCDQTMVRYQPRYGCGKCQTGVPCESRIPIRLKGDL